MPREETYPKCKLCGERMFSNNHYDYHCNVCLRHRLVRSIMFYGIPIAGLIILAAILIIWF